MRKRFLTAMLAATMAIGLTLTGCGNSSQSSSEGKEDSKTLVLYSPNQPELTNKMVNMFKEKSGIDVEVIQGGTGELLKRVQSEKDNPLGDVFWAGGAESLEAFKDYFEPYKTSEAENVPDKYQSEDGSWSGFCALPMVIVYNKDLVSEDKVPQGWEDLLNPEWKGKISYTDPNKSGSSYTQMLTMYTAMGGWDFVGKFAEQLDGKVESSSTHVCKKVSDGEMPIGITLEDNAYRYMINGANVGIIYPKEGTSAVADGMSLIKGAKHSEAGKQFLDFLQTKEAQDIVGSEIKRRAVRKDVEPLEGLVPLNEIKLIDYDFDMASTKKKENLKKWKELFIK